MAIALVATVAGRVPAGASPAPLSCTSETPLVGTTPPGECFMGYAAVDQWFDTPIPIVGGTGPYTATLVSGYLPTGLALEPDGTIEGYALFPQDATFTVQIADSSSPAETLTTSIGLEAFAEPFSPSPGSAGIPEVVQADDLLLPLTQQVGPEAVQLHNDTGGGGQTSPIVTELLDLASTEYCSVVWPVILSVEGHGPPRCYGI